MKTYYLQFGSGDPAAFTGLSPTFLIFNAGGLTALSGPSVAETPAGSGLYSFAYGTTQSIIFKVDGGSVLSASSRYIVGALDPVQAVDEKVGYVTDSFGSTSVDPTTLFGKMNRSQEFLEGNKVYTKATGLWDIYSRGSSTLLREKALTNTTTSAGST